MPVSPSLSLQPARKGKRAATAALLLVLFVAVLPFSAYNRAGASNALSTSDNALVAANSLGVSNESTVSNSSIVPVVNGSPPDPSLANWPNDNVTSIVQASISLRVQTRRLAIGETLLVKIVVSPLPPKPEDVFGNVTLLVQRPDGTVDLLGPFLTDSTGLLSVSYTPEMMGIYRTHANYEGQFFTSRNMTYLGAEGAEATFMVLSDLAPKTWTVDDDGPADFHTIQEAINAADEGDTILVMSGFYREEVVVNKTLSLFGTNKLDTIIDGNHSWTVVSLSASSSSIYGFTIQNSGISREGYPEGLIMVSSNGNSIRGNTIKNGANRGIEIGQDGNEVVDNEVLNVFYGILLMSSSDNTIAKNRVANCTYGVMLYEGCRNNTVNANNVSSCRNAGIFVGPVPAGGGYAQSFGNRVSDNDLWANDYGLWLGGASYGSTVTGNTVRKNNQGVYLQSTVDNELTGNEITGNTLGIYMDGSCNNTRIYNNDFSNSRQIENRASNFRLPIYWDDGYSSGGNYWSDYKGIDANHDGTGDSPYVIDANNVDRYPFMTPR